MLCCEWARAGLGVPGKGLDSWGGELGGWIEGVEGVKGEALRLWARHREREREIEVWS